MRQEPYALPDGFEWVDVDMHDAAEVAEVYALLHGHYVEDDDGMFRFDYSPAFLAWALQPPGARRDWHVGVRSGPKRRLVAFISAIPATVAVNGGEGIEMVEINFLCVHKKLRSKRLAPVLIKVCVWCCWVCLFGVMVKCSRGESFPYPSPQTPLPPA